MTENPADFERFHRYYYESKGQIDQRIDEILDDHKDFATHRRLLSHATVGGKRVRPVLTTLTADVYGTPYDKALNHAAIVELIHNASLVVDDRVDGDEDRRGKPAMWRVLDRLPFGRTGEKVTNALTVMTQNGLLAVALEVAEDPDVVNAMGQSVNRLVDGFFMEGREVFRGLLGGGYDRYIEINKTKTGGLFALATWMPATYVDVGEGGVNAARKYGESVGILYQVTDDYVDGDLPSFIDDPGAEMETWYEEAISWVPEMPDGENKDLLYVAPAYMAFKMLEQEGMVGDVDVSFIPGLSEVDLKSVPEEVK